MSSCTLKRALLHLCVTLSMRGQCCSLLKSKPRWTQSAPLATLRIQTDVSQHFHSYTL